MVQSSTPNFKNFLKLLIGNLNAGRAVLEKTAKEIINAIKTSLGDKVFQEEVLKEAGLSEEEQKLINAALVEKGAKGKGGFKDFLKNKKEGKETNQ